jgi:hypothetical protein
MRMPIQRTSRPSRFAAASAIVLTTILAPTLDAANVRYMTLQDLVTRADQIVRGTVIASDESTVSAGGGAVPIVTYRIRVEESLKGGAAAGETIEVRLLGRPKQAIGGSLRRGPFFNDLPQFTVGSDYLFVLTRPSAIGLSTTVGLRQGLFELRGRRGAELAVNGANNLGLFTATTAGPRTSGPVAYGELVKRINSLLGR